MAYCATNCLDIGWPPSGPSGAAAREASQHTHTNDGVEFGLDCIYILKEPTDIGVSLLYWFMSLKAPLLSYSCFVLEVSDNRSLFQKLLCSGQIVKSVVIALPLTASVANEMLITMFWIWALEASLALIQTQKFQWFNDDNGVSFIISIWVLIL